MRLINKYLSNLVGWSTKRKIIVIESDDWGSIYMSDRNAYDKLNKLGYKLDSNHFLKYDSLESNDDVRLFLDVLSSFKDSTGRCPVVTNVNIVANPNFDKIRDNNFEEYIYESIIETYRKFRNRDKVYNMFLKAQDERLVVPVFHGREHLNVQRWMRLLKSNDETIKELFDYNIPCVSVNKYGKVMPDLRAAFSIDSLHDLDYLYKVINTGISLFKDIYNFSTQFAILTNGVYNNNLEPILAQNHIKYLGTSKLQLEDIGNGKYKRHFHYLGMKNKYDMLYMTRNCFFEPCISTSYIDRCLKEIEIAFRCFKPAIISSHRVNYSGEIFPQNRENGIKSFRKLLGEIIKKWPEVEFMTSAELGNLMCK